MKFIKPGDWVTPAKNRQGEFGDSFPPGVHLVTLLQALTYPVAAVVSVIGSIATKGK